MTTQSRHNRKSYSSIYKIYRRFRFLRHRRKTLRKKALEARHAGETEKAELRRKLREFRIEQNAQQRLKRKADRERLKAEREELALEFKERRKQARIEFEKLLKEDREKARLNRLQAKKERRRLFRFYLRSQFRRLLLSYRLLSPGNIRKSFHSYRQGAPKRKSFFIITANSTVMFLFSYLSLFLLSQATTVIAAGFFNFPTIVYYYEVYFNISPDEWYHDAVKTIFSAGPLLNLLIGFSFLIIFNNIRELTGVFKLFFLWGFLHTINMLFGAMLIGTLFETGVGHVISWMYVMDTGKMLYSIVSIFILVLTGLVATRQFLFTGNSYYNKLDRQNSTLFIMAQVLLPYILGNAAMILIRQPKFIFYDTFVLLTLIIVIIPVLATYRTYNDLYFEEGEKKQHITWISLLLLMLLILFFRGVLSMGLHFSA